MKPERWQQVNDLFQSAIERAPEERLAFLEEACQGDERLRRVVECLIAGDQRAQNFIEAPAFEVVPELLTNESASAMVGAQDLDLAAHQRFGTYEIERRADGTLYELGRGAMGVTYRAIDKVLDRLVALKIISTELRSRSAEARERFMREARAAAALHHPNVATVYQFGVREDTGQFFYAMELVEGETLEQRVNRAGPLDVGTAIEIAQQVTAALAAAEKRGLIHRDLKPANLMLVSADHEAAGPYRLMRRKRTAQRAVPTVKIIDFGLAKALNAPSAAMSLTHDHFVGTPAFASPEQFTKAPVDVRSDIYSLGVTLWFLLTGYMLFSGRTIEQIRETRQSMQLPIEELKAAHVPSRLRSLLKSMLAVDPAARPGTRDLAAQLRRCFAQASSVHRARIALAAAAILFLGVSAFFGSRWSQTGRGLVATTLAAPEKSIAVLPFENLSEEKANEFFADGVQDEVLTDLSRIADLKVISRTSVMHYKSGITRNLREIGQQLGVAHVVEGSVQRTGNRVRVNAQLIDARTDAHLWAQTYDRDLADVFAIQSEIAKTIADQLQAKLSPAEKKAIERPPTSDLAAFDVYTRGKNLILRAGSIAADERANTLQGIDLLNRAVARDPSFFDAYCQLAWAHDGMYILGYDHTSSRLAMADAAVEAASRLRPDAGETHLARAQNLYQGYLDYDGALAELELARETVPNDWRVFFWTGLIERRQGRWEESIRNSERAISLDPRNFFALEQTAQSYQALRRYAQEKSTHDRVLAFEPDDVVTKVAHAVVELNSEADTRMLHQTIDSIRATNPAAIPNIADGWLLCALAERDTAAAKNALIAIGQNPTNLASVNNVRFNRPFFEGVIAQMTKDGEKARSSFEAARKEQQKIVQAEPNYAPAICVLALIDAGLGRKEEALREGQRAVEILPPQKDALDGSGTVKYLAMIAAWIGDKDLACEQLATAVRIPSGLSYGQLKLLPFWDALRGDPRFEKLVEESKKPIAMK
jgi:serine/threonine protein kinase/tetratricopeptide (TPR) repeat protein